MSTDFLFCNRTNHPLSPPRRKSLLPVPPDRMRFTSYARNHPSLFHLLCKGSNRTPAQRILRATESRAEAGKEPLPDVTILQTKKQKPKTKQVKYQNGETSMGYGGWGGLFCFRTQRATVLFIYLFLYSFVRLFVLLLQNQYSGLGVSAFHHFFINSGYTATKRLNSFFGDRPLIISFLGSFFVHTISHKIRNNETQSDLHIHNSISISGKFLCMYIQNKKG